MLCSGMKGIFSIEHKIADSPLKHFTGANPPDVFLTFLVLFPKRQSYLQREIAGRK